MKKKSILKIFAVLIMMVGFAMTTFGQDITASANVVTAVSVTSGIDLQFGNVTPGNDKTIDAANNVIQGTAAGTLEATGTWTIDKGGDTQVTITLTLPSYLVGASTTHPHLGLNYAEYNSTKLGAIGSVAWTPVTATAVPVTKADYPTEFAASSFTVYVGGTVTPGSTQLADSYSGTLSLSAVYN
jgi:hypothetical protein